jgi:hypothetical protein
MYKIDRIKIAGFRRSYSVDLPVLPFMILIGANGVGKTSLLDAFAVLSASASENLYETLSEFGGIANLLTRGKRSELSLLVDMTVPGHEPLEYELHIDPAVRTSRSAIDPSIWLRVQYTNEDGQMVCQRCKKEMPFKKLDLKYYFEAVEAFTKDIFPKEHEAQFLALCPLCAAMYKELVKKDEATMAELRKGILNMDLLEAPLRLGNLETTIQFVETHCHDLKTILEEMG